MISENIFKRKKLAYSPENQQNDPSMYNAVKEL